MPKIRQARDFPGDIGESGDLLYRAEAGDDMPPKVVGVDVFRRMGHKLITAQSSVPAGTYARALDELKENLGVTLTYIARCLGPQRSAVYRWYEGRLPHPANRSRLQTVREFAQAWREAKLPSLREYWDTPAKPNCSTRSY